VNLDEKYEDKLQFKGKSGDLKAEIVERRREGVSNNPSPARCQFSTGHLHRVRH
jgi:hypothetical protein